MNQPALQILPVPRSETTVSLSEEVTPKSPPTPRSPDTEQLDRHLTSATQALNELRESVLARPRSLYEPVIALSQRGTSSEGALRHNSMGTYGTVLSRAATQALRSPLSADTKLSSPYFTPDSSPRVRNWRAEYQRMRRASLVDLDEEDTQDVLNPTSVQGVSSLRNEAVPSDSLFMRRFSSDFETSPESSDEAGPHAQLSSMPDTDGDSPTLGRLNQDPIDSPVTRGRTLKRTVGGLQGQNGQNQLLGDDGEVSGARDTVTNSSIGDTLDQVDEDDNDPLDQDETLVERDSMNGLGGGIGLGLFGMPDEDQPFMGARDLLDGKTDDVEQMGQTYVQQLPSSDAVPEGPAAIKNLKDGAAMSATGPTSSTPAHLVGRDVAVDSPIAGAKADPTTPSVDRADPVLQKIQSRAVSVENPDIGGASADPDTSSLEQSSSNVLQNVQDRDVSFENPAVGEASADPKTPSLGQGASALQLVKGREVRIDGPNFGANASPKSPSLDGAAKPSIPARFLRRGLYERYWNLTQSSAPSSPTFATTSWSNPCPPTTTTGKSWTSALATSESMPSSPQMLNSPTLGTSAPNSPMLTQTPTMASATNSPMVSQTPNMANTSDAFNMPGAFSTPVPTDAQYQSGESQGNGAPESHAYHPGPPVVAATAVGSLVLLGALIWALLMLNKRSKRRRHLREVLEKFGSGGDGKSSLSIESHGRSLDLAEKAVFDGSDTKPSAGGYGASGKLGIDSTAYFNQQSTDQLNVISPWLTYEDSRSGDAADSARISTDLARSGIVTTQLVPQKDVTFTWQHPTLALPPAAARALAVGHYIKKRATLPPKVRVPAVGPAGPAGMSRVMSEGTVRVADHGETSGAEAVSSSSCIDPELESPPGTPRIDGQGVHSDTAPEQSTTGGRSDTESTNADGGRTWLSLVLGKGRKPDMQKPEDRNGSPPSISSAGTPTQTSGPSLGSSDSEGSAEVRFVTAKPSNPSTATANAFSGRDAMAVASRLVNQISLPKRNSTNSIRSTSTYSMQSSESSTDPYMMRSSMRDSARVSFAQASGSGSKRRMPGWHNSLPPCREDSNENMGGKARSSLSPLPKAFLASLGEGTEDSSEDELRQGYEAGEETDTDTGRHLGQSHSAGEFGAPAHSSPLARPGSISSPHISGLSPMATSSKARSADSLSPSVYNSCDTTPSSSTGAVHKRAPRLPPMLVPSITLTLDDDTFGLVERPLSLVSSNDSDRESMPNMRHFAGNPAAPDLRVPQQAGSGSNKGGMSIDVGQQSIRSAVEAAGIERETMYDDLLDDDSEGPHVAPPAGWADRDEDGYGSDSAEGCLELSDFPTLPPWTPMEKSKRAPRAHAGGR